MVTRRMSAAARLLAELQRDPALRDEWARVLGEGVATKADLGRIFEQLAEQGRILERHSHVLEEHGRAIEEVGRRLEVQGRAIEELVRAVSEQGQRIAAAFLRVEALGARWGLHSESAFREAMRTVLDRRFGARVQHWETVDQEGVVFGRPSSVEVDLVVRNGGTLLIEIKSHVSQGDLATFQRKAELYERQVGVHADRLVVSPSVEARALDMARELGIDVSTSLE